MLRAKKEGYFRSDDSGIMGWNLEELLGVYYLDEDQD